MKMKSGLLWFCALVLTVFLGLTTFNLPAHAFSSSDYDHLLQTNECNGCDLTGADLSGEDFYGSALIGAD